MAVPHSSTPYAVSPTYKSSVVDALGNVIFACSPNEQGAATAAFLVAAANEKAERDAMKLAVEVNSFIGENRIEFAEPPDPSPEQQAHDASLSEN